MQKFTRQQLVASFALARASKYNFNPASVAAAPTPLAQPQAFTDSFEGRSINPWCRSPSNLEPSVHRQPWPTPASGRRNSVRPVVASAKCT